MTTRWISLFLTAVCMAVNGASLCSQQISWPAHNPRVEWVRTIAGAQDVGAGEGFFQKILSVLFGSETGTQAIIQPTGVAVFDGRIFVADPGAQCVHVFNMDEKEYDVITDADRGRLISPVGVAVDAGGILYVSDSQTGRIITYSRRLKPRFAVTENLNRPTGLAIAGDSLYVADAGDHRIKVLSLDGHFLSSIGGRGTDSSLFNFPIALIADSALYVVDALNFRIQAFDREGRFLRQFGKVGNVTGTFGNPKGIATDSDGNLYVTDAVFDAVQIFDREGRLLLVFGSRGSRNGEFFNPGGVAVDASDRVYVVDSLNKRIQIFQYRKPVP